MFDKKAAVLDLGTNTFHLLMVELSECSFNILYKEKIPVKIGQDGININIITPEAQKRAFHTVAHFSNLIRGENIDHVFVFGTSAIRSATNGREFVDEIQRRFNLKVHVINGDQEAQLIYEGIKHSGCLNADPSLMMDIGGGSVEFIIGNNKKAFWKQSFEIGGQRLLDLFPYHDPPLPEELDKLTDYLETQLTPLLKALKDFPVPRLVGASGTFDTLTDIHLAATGQAKEQNRPFFPLPISEFERIAHLLSTSNRAQRLEIPGMVAMRVDMIVVAVGLIRFVLKYLESPQIICSAYALKEGVISQLIRANQAAFST